jgi:hypothetical protein
VFVEVLETKSTAGLGCGEIIVKYTNTHTHRRRIMQLSHNIIPVDVIHTLKC